MKLLSGGQSGVDRAVLDVAIERGIDYGGWCPNGGWAEDLPKPPRLLAKYPKLKETPLVDPAQRTEWNVRDADACMIVIAAGGLAVSKGTTLAEELAHRHRKPGLVPVTLGLTAASAVVVARAADDTRVAVGITVATALMTYWIRVNPLWIFAVAALLGLSGVV